MSSYKSSRIYIQLAMLLCMISLVGLCGCDEPESDPYVDIIGDSIMARWDVQECFPSSIVKNHALGGSGIEYIESFAGRMSGRTVVMMSGTNDNGFFPHEDVRNWYVGRYLDAVRGLGADRVILLSVLPRDFPGDRSGMNDDIKAFNEGVAERVAGIEGITYLDVYEDFIRDGKLREECFSDGLHLTDAGYEVLTKALRNAL